MIHFLQDIVVGKELVQQLDTINVHEKFQDGIQSIVNTFQTSTPQEIMRILLEDAVEFGLKILAAIIIYLVGIWVTRILKNGVKKSMARRNADPSVASFILSLISVCMTLIIIILSIGALGINTTSIAALLAAIGMALGMAMSGAMGNFAGGVLLLIFKPFKSGDYISAQGVEGKVESISIFSTKIITADNKTIFLPNGSLSNGTIQNYNTIAVRRIEILVDTAYGTGVEQMKQACAEIMAADKRILDKKNGALDEPYTEVRNLKDSSVQFTVRCWVKTSDYWPVFFNLNNNLYSRLPEYGISFPFPQMDVHIKNS